MAWITLQNAHLGFGHVALLDGTDFALEQGERVGLIGRNGTGKSSLLKILAGIDKADDGELKHQGGVRIAYVPQEPELFADESVFDAVKRGLAEVVKMVDDYTSGEGDIDALHAAIDSQDGWTWESRVSDTLQRLSLNGALQISALSGGMKKRVALAQALVQRPDVLLLDEPTNHLDLDSITWLEELLIAFKGAIITITHDRAFLDRVATRIVELDRGQLRGYPGNFASYEGIKEREMADEAVVNAKFDKLLAQEEVWIRRGVEARRTRAVARIERLAVMRNQAAERRKAQGSVNFALDAGNRSGKIVCDMEHVSKSFELPGGGRKTVVNDFSATIMRGDKIGLVGPNGCGKTTLLKMILGELAPDAAAPHTPDNAMPKLRLGTQISVAYFDQMRDALDPEATLEDFISPGSEWIEIGGAKKHVRSYLNDFLFSPARSRSPVKSLSGGERNRLLLARLFARPANVLVLDEPTNDLDIDTLSLLEELLDQYTGTVFLVSHDRRFLDNVVTSLIVNESTPERSGQWREYVGGIEDWLIQSKRAGGAGASSAKGSAFATYSIASSVVNTRTEWVNDVKNGSAGTQNASPGPAAAQTSQPSPPKRKLSYKEQREKDAIPGQLAGLEAEQSSIQTQLADGTLYATEPAEATRLAQRSAEIDEEMLHLMERQEALAG